MRERGWLVAWALLVPIAHLPLLLFGAPPPPRMMALLAVATLGACAAPILAFRTRVLDTLAGRLDRAALPLLGSGVAIYVVLSVIGAARGVAAFGAYGQVGMFNQSFWTTLHGQLFANSVLTRDGTLCSQLAVHFSPTLLLLALPYALWPAPLTLQAAHALAFGLIPLPLYALLKLRAGPGVAAVLALSALLVPNFLLGGARDMHYAGFLPLILFTAVWALETRHRAVLWLAAVAALGVREDTGLVVALLGLYALVRGHGAGVALGLAALGIAWSMVVVRVVMPQLASPSLIWTPEYFMNSILGGSGQSPGRAVLGMVSHPVGLLRALASGQNAHYLFRLLLPLLGLPAFADWSILPALPALGVNMLSAWPYMRSPSYQYSIVPAAFATLAALQLAARLGSRGPAGRREAAGLGAALVVICGMMPSLGQLDPAWGEQAVPLEPARAVTRLIPAGASLYAPSVFYAPLSSRAGFGLAESVGERMLEPGFRSRYEYVVVWPGQPVPDSPHDRALVALMAGDTRFELARAVGPFIVYRRRSGGGTGEPPH